MSGVPTMVGVGPINVLVRDAGNPFQDKDLYLQNYYVYDQLKVVTASLPEVAENAPAKIELHASGGSGNYTWSAASGALPAGLMMDPIGTISGQTTATGNFAFTAEVSDAGPPTQTAEQALELTVGSPGRNDTPATATPLSNGTYAASISPIADPPNGMANPDADYYKLTANPGAIVTVEITAQRLNPPSPLDSVLEIVDGSGNRLSLCSSTPSNTSGPFASACLDDDIPQPVATTDSKLILQVPAGNAGPRGGRGRRQPRGPKRSLS
jgi:Putative Ig domain